MGVAEIINLDTLEVRVRVMFVRLVDQLNYVLAGTLRKKVKAKIGILSALVLAVALCSVSVAAGQTSVSISFNGSYSAVSCIGPEGCVGAGLYGGTINGVNVGAGQAVHGMICDDY